MGLKELAEEILLQSIEDLWDEKRRDDSITFFRGEGAGICAELAGMNLYDEVRLFNLVEKIINGTEGRTVKRKGLEPFSTIQR